MTPADHRRRLPAAASVSDAATADGHRLRVFDWPPGEGIDPRGSLLWLGGRADFTEKYLETFAHWHARGWHVTSFDWRGQGGSGRLLDDAGIGHIDDFATWIDDLAAFWADWTRRASGPHVVLGHSMGGHLVLRALVERRIAPTAAVLVAPMLGFEAGPVPPAAAARAVAVLGRAASTRRAWKGNERPASARASRQGFLTSDLTRYADETWWKETDHTLGLGPPSWGWMAAAYRSFAVLERPGAVEGVDVPVLVLGTEGDKLVSPRAIRAHAARLARGTLHMWDAGVAHEILRERDEIRDDALARIDAFLGGYAPARSAA